MIAGPEGTDRAERLIPMTNAARSPTYYQFDPGEWLEVYRGMQDRDEEAVVVYHSHTGTEAYPSVTDVRIADHYAMFLRSPHYVLVSTRDPDEHELRSYKIDNSVITEEPVVVVDSYLSSRTS